LHRDCGLTYVTDAVSPIGAGEEIGPLRDTEFSFYGNLKRPGDQLRGCTAGAPAALRCTVPAGSPPQVGRVCESSRALGCGTACRYHEALTNVTIRPGETANVAFTCPSPRDNAAFGETGGAYSIYRAMAPRPGEPTTVSSTCPSPRDNAAFGETGGAYSIYRAMAFGPDGARTGPDVTCVAHSPAGFRAR